MSSPNLSIVSLLLQSVLEAEESSEDVLAIVIFQFLVEVLHIGKNTVLLQLVSKGLGFKSTE